MDLTLERVRSDVNGVYGVLIKDRPFALTLERPWLDNQPNISCIPPGVYKCLKFNSREFGVVWELQNVKGRSGILIHWGNFTEDSEGCILIGSTFSDISDDKIKDLASSRLAFYDFMLMTKNEVELTLTIVDLWNPIV